MIISFWWRNNTVVFTLLLIATVAVLLLSKNKRFETVIFLTGALFGPSMEAIAIRAGAWQYANPSFTGIPMWLPLLWGLTAVFLMKIARWMTPGMSS